MKKKKKLIPIIIFVAVILLFAARNIYEIDPDACRGCGHCVEVCNAGAISFNYMTFAYDINPNLCTGCGNCFNICGWDAVHEVVSTNENLQKQSNLNIYPNPAKRSISLEFSHRDEKIVKIEIYNAKGQKVNTIESHFNQLNLLDNQGKKLPAGLYFYNIKTDKGFYKKSVTVI